jgi:cytochrome c-type biogenesis protein CcmH
VTFWLILVVLCLAAIAFAVLPLWRSTRRLSPLIATVIVFTVGVSAALYNQIGSPGLPSGRASDSLPGMEDAIASLEARLAANPGDAEGWSLLGRTYMSLGNFDGAVAAFETAMDVEGGTVAQTMVDLAVAILNRDQSAIAGRTASLIESALALEPNNQAALFYSGIAAANRGDTDTAASRWEVLLSLNPPDNVRGVLERGIAEWRGEAPPAAPAQPAVAGEAAADDSVVSARIALSDQALAAMNRDANVFIIARDPAAPSPPIAVTRRLLSELPAVVSLGDAESMVEGRNLSMFAEIELLARVSLSGSPAASSGDWFGSILVRPAENDSVFLTIDQQVP